MMAEMATDTAMNTEIDEEIKDCHLRRLVSNEYYNDQIRVLKMESRYRSPSRGSCHDLCKCGFKSDPDTKVWRFLVRRNSLDSRKTAKMYEVLKKEIPEASKQASTMSLRRQTSSPAQIKRASEKNTRVLRPKTTSLAATQRLHSERIVPKYSEPLYGSSMGGSIGQKNSDKKVNKEIENSKKERKKIPGREKFSLSSMSSTKRILGAQSDCYVKKLKKVPSTLDYRKKIKEVDNKCRPSEYVIEKTPHVIGSQTRNQAVGLAKRGSSTSSKVSEDKSLEYGECTVNASYSPPTENTHTSLSSLESQSSTSSSPEAMQSDGSAFDIDNSEIEYSTTELQAESMRTPRVQVLNKDGPSSQTLKFRRGSVVDVQLEDLSPSRLKFRHEEALDEEISDTECISLRGISSDGVSYETDSEAEKVTLKHQEMEAKEETWGMVNDVIEETANRLARSRKSKVKALVGAFEAVLGGPDSPRI